MPDFIRLNPFGRSCFEYSLITIWAISLALTLTIHWLPDIDTTRYLYFRALFKIIGFGLFAFLGFSYQELAWIAFPLLNGYGDLLELAYAKLSGSSGAGDDLGDLEKAQGVKRP